MLLLKAGQELLKVYNIVIKKAKYTLSNSKRYMCSEMSDSMWCAVNSRWTYSLQIKGIYTLNVFIGYNQIMIRIKLSDNWQCCIHKTNVKMNVWNFYLSTIVFFTISQPTLIQW